MKTPLVIAAAMVTIPTAVLAGYAQLGTIDVDLTNPTLPSPVAGTFTFGTSPHPDWSGTFSAEITEVSSPDFRAVMTGNDNRPLSDLETSFTNSYSSAEVDDLLIVGSHRPQKIEFDFSTLTNGYLPAGTLLFLIDIDDRERGFLQASAPGNSALLGSEWLSFVERINMYDLQATIPDPDVANDDQWPIVPWDDTNDLYDFYGVNTPGGPSGSNLGNLDNGAMVFQTTENIDLLTVRNSSQRSSTYFVAFADPTVVIPEPGSMVFVGWGILLAAGRRRNQPPRQHLSGAGQSRSRF